MPEWLIVVLGVVGGLVLLWLSLIGLLWVQQRRTGSAVDWRAMMRLVPDVIRLVRRLATDPAVPRATRWWLSGLLGYLLLPFDLVPDFIPVLGFADDAVVVAIVLRFAIRHAGPDAVERHWPGSAEGLASVLRLAGLTSRTSPTVGQPPSDGER
ncbi:YkvA family protein [Microbacterium pumilum]|uniref:YkvA family protein n=1 Tax=Microbacterium pumilum TaxID=344165 RepID=A0ABP5DN55_9MICO